MLSLSQRAATMTRGRSAAGMEVGFASPAVRRLRAPADDDQETILPRRVVRRGPVQRTAAIQAGHYPISAGIWADGARSDDRSSTTTIRRKPGDRGLPRPFRRAATPRRPDTGKTGRPPARRRRQQGRGHDDDDVRDLELIGADLWRIVTRRRLRRNWNAAKEAAESAARRRAPSRRT